MSFKVFVGLTLIAVVTAGVYHHEPVLVHHAAPVVHHSAPILVHHHDHYDHHSHDDHSAPQPYDFKYGVHDSHTGDVKDQHESADGHGNVHGSYSLIDADGFKRTVKYTADDHNGFNAEVHREPLGHGHGHGHIVAAAPAHHISYDDHHHHH